MDTAHYDILRHFADSWGLLYMVAIFLAVVVMIVRPGAKANARAAALIPLKENEPGSNGP
jgi:cytochrome c oxidase cbb3-type subunit IV